MPASVPRIESKSITAHSRAVRESHLCDHRVYENVGRFARSAVSIKPFTPSGEMMPISPSTQRGGGHEQCRREHAQVRFAKADRAGYSDMPYTAYDKSAFVQL